MKNFNEDYDYLGNSASASDCTGLKLKAPVDEAQDEAYEDVYHYLPPKIKVDTSNET